MENKQPGEVAQPNAEQSLVEGNQPVNDLPSFSEVFPVNQLALMEGPNLPAYDAVHTMLPVVTENLNLPNFEGLPVMQPIIVENIAHEFMGIDDYVLADISANVIPFETQSNNLPVDSLPVSNILPDFYTASGQLPVETGSEDEAWALISNAVDLNVEDNDDEWNNVVEWLENLSENLDV